LTLAPDALAAVQLETADNGLRVEVVAEVDVQIPAFLQVDLDQRVELGGSDMLDEPGLADLPGCPRLAVQLRWRACVSACEADTRRPQPSALSTNPPLNRTVPKPRKVRKSDAQTLARSDSTRKEVER